MNRVTAPPADETVAGLGERDGVPCEWKLHELEPGWVLELRQAVG